jgi:putative transcriptional regulator
MREKTSTDTALAFAQFAFFATWVTALVWLRPEEPWQRTALFLSFLLASYGVVIVAHVRADRRLDEVELAAARFGARWGLLTGVLFMTVLVMLPPVHTFLAETAAYLGRIKSRAMTVESRLVLLAIITTSIAQEIFRSIFAAAWKWSKR